MRFIRHSGLTVLLFLSFLFAVAYCLPNAVPNSSGDRNDAIRRDTEESSRLRRTHVVPRGDGWGNLPHLPNEDDVDTDAVEERRRDIASRGDGWGNLPHLPLPEDSVETDTTESKRSVAARAENGDGWGNHGDTDATETTKRNADTLASRGDGWGNLPGMPLPSGDNADSDTTDSTKRSVAARGGDGDGWGNLPHVDPDTTESKRGVAARAENGDGWGNHGDTDAPKSIKRGDDGDGWGNHGDTDATMKRGEDGDGWGNHGDTDATESAKRVLRRALKSDGNGNRGEEPDVESRSLKGDGNGNRGGEDGLDIEARGDGHGNPGHMDAVGESDEANGNTTDIKPRGNGWGNQRPRAGQAGSDEEASMKAKRSTSSPHIPQQKPLQDNVEVSADDELRFNFSSSAPHIFSSLHSLLQQWPNTFFPAGHSIVPSEIPAYTLLYHGRPADDLPPSPEFLAFDIEMAYAIMGNARDSHILTYQTTRPVRALYFDGQSAALMGSGAMDAQMVFLYGNATGPASGGYEMLGGEYARARGLCNWAFENGFGGPGWGIESIIRMNAGFEMMWCNFSSPSLRLISHHNVTAPLLPQKRSLAQTYIDAVSEDVSDDDIAPSQSVFPLPTTTASYDAPTATAPPEFELPDNWREMQLREPYLYAAGFEWFRSTTWKYGSTGAGLGKGEIKAKALTCGFLSYYGPQFQGRAAAIASGERGYLNLTDEGFWNGPGPNGTIKTALHQLESRRRNHNLWTFESAEAVLMNEDAKQALNNIIDSSSSCTGMDWTALSDEIVQRYAKPLAELSRFLSSFAEMDTSDESVRKYLSAARIRSHAFLLPYMEYPQTSLPEGSEGYNQWLNKTWSLSSQLGQDTLSHCRYSYTRLLHDLDNPLNPQEALLKSSIEEVLTSICSTTITVGFGVERLWFTHFNALPSSSCSTVTTELLEPSAALSTLTQDWSHLIDVLMAYLGWAPFTTTCANACAWDEFCWIPMWPLQPMFAPVLSNTTNRLRGPWDDNDGPHNRTDGSPGHGHGPGRGRGHYGLPGGGPGGGPPDFNRNSSTGHGGMDNLPVRNGSRMRFGMDMEDGLWEPRCVKIQDMNRDSGL